MNLEYRLVLTFEKNYSTIRYRHKDEHSWKSLEIQETDSDVIINKILGIFNESNTIKESG